MRREPEVVYEDEIYNEKLQEDVYLMSILDDHYPPDEQWEREQQGTADGKDTASLMFPMHGAAVNATRPDSVSPTVRPPLD